MSFRDELPRDLSRIAAYQRVRLRRWLRQFVPLDEQPDGIYLDMDISDLKEAIIEVGGDAQHIFEDITAGALLEIRGI